MSDAISDRMSNQPANQAQNRMLLSHVNAAPAQTWNWLSINETKLELPLPEGFSEEGIKAAEKTLGKNLADTENGKIAKRRASQVAAAVEASAGGKELAAWIALTASKKNKFVAKRNGKFVAKQDSALVAKRNVKFVAKQDSALVAKRNISDPLSSSGSASASDSLSTAGSVSASDSLSTAGSVGTSDSLSSPSSSFMVFLGPENPVQETFITVEEGAEATLSIAALGTEADSFTTAHSLIVSLEKGARLTINNLVAETDAQTHIETVGGHIAQEAILDAHQFFLGAGHIVYGLGANLPDKEGNFEGTSRYIVSGGQTLDLTFNLYQKGDKTKTSLSAAGVLSGNAKKTLRATIDLQKGCKGATGTENETVVLAGGNVMNKTLPVILCAEDDVEGNHGATIGSLSPEMLFYLGCRGVNEEQATDLMQEAILDDAVATLPSELSEAALEWTKWAIGPSAYTTARAGRELKANEPKGKL